ncbi:hypothetical protein XAC301_37880 [Xanthomonas arboricola pv. corylina]|uniref:Restriction endonuclease n=2 Tax=Xanthomonas arboricola TaxID=56448 RepID=A0ABM8SWK4_9XANT|nr:hypothetical protein XAC301_37880 [Xanthomonas arboricola pv. corylina]CAE6838136.1 hypothetical protein XAC301_37880 [Xanthomonas arboricola pv. corylina]
MMNAADPWKSLLPKASAENVLAFVVKTFDELRAENPRRFHFGMGEVPLSERLGVRLQNSQAECPVVGHWHYEDRTNVADESDPRRIDLTFQTVRDNAHAISLIFECKKIAAAGSAAKKHEKAYLAEGVDRFAVGSYAPNEPHGFMLGFAEGTKAPYIARLKKLFAEAGKAGACGWDNVGGSAFVAPPAHFAKNAPLSTRHRRRVKSPAGPTITVYHIPLMLTVFPSIKAGG